jgi:hypothetical protein
MFTIVTLERSRSHITAKFYMGLLNMIAIIGLCCSVAMRDQLMTDMA